MDGAVLAHLERREVESERRQLPAQLGDLAPGDPTHPVAHERFLDLAQLDVEGFGIGIGAGPRTGLACADRARSTQSLGDEPEALPIWLVREATAQLTIGLGELLRVSRETRRERFRDPVVGRRGRLGLHQPQRDRLIAVQDVIGLDPQGVTREVGCDHGVPVAIPTDPRPEAQERRRPWRSHT